MAIITASRKIEPVPQPRVEQKVEKAQPQELLSTGIIKMLDTQHSKTLEQQLVVNASFIDAVQELVNVKKRVTVTKILRNTKGLIEHLEMVV